MVKADDQQTPFALFHLVFGHYNDDDYRACIHNHPASSRIRYVTRVSATRLSSRKDTVPGLRLRRLNSQLHPQAADRNVFNSRQPVMSYGLIIQESKEGKRQ